MAKADDPTREKILHSALALFSKKGIGKTGMGEVAYAAGVTRVTVYRYFGDKETLVREAFLNAGQVFERGLAALEENPQGDWERVMHQIGEGLGALPSSNMFARFDEIKRLYPQAYEAVQAQRVAALNGIFEHVFTAAERQGRLRPGLNRTLVQAIFWELVVNIFDNPRFKTDEISGVELYRAIIDFLRHGILVS